MDDGWVHPLAINLAFSCRQLVMNDCHGWLKIGWKSLGKWQQLQHCKSMIPPKKLQGTTNNVGLTFSVGDTTPWLTISIEQGKELVTLNIIYCVLVVCILFLLVITMLLACTMRNNGLVSRNCYKIYHPKNNPYIIIRCVRVGFSNYTSQFDVLIHPWTTLWTFLAISFEISCFTCD